MTHTLLTNIRILLALALLISFSSCKNQTPKNQTPTTPITEKKETVPPEPVAVVPPPVVKEPEVKVEEPVKKEEQIFKGTATYYHDKFQGRKTASGEPYDRNKYTAAIRTNAITLPFGSIVEVYSEKRDKKVRVKINDKMSNKSKSIIDLSYKAAEEIGLINDGRAKVSVRLVEENE